MKVTSLLAGRDAYLRFAFGWMLLAGAATRSPAQLFSSVDIGTSTVGSTTAAGGNVTLIGSGRDIWNDADGFRFHSIPTTEDFDLVVRVRSLDYTHGWAKAGIMARAGLEPGAAHTFVCVSAAHGTAYQGRATLGGESNSSAPTEDGAAPRWLRLKRTTGYMQAWFIGYTSFDGVAWTEAGATFASYHQPVYLGLAVTSHNDGVLCRAEFDQVQLTLPPAAPTGMRITHLGPNGLIEMEWTDNAADETGFVVQLQASHRDASPNTIGTVGANVNRFTTNYSEGQNFRLTVAAVKDGVKSVETGTDGRTTIAPMLSISGVTATSIALRWSEPFVNRSGPGYGPYSLERSTDNANWVVLANGLIANDSYYTNYTDSTVATGVTYYYRVRYLDSSGNASGYGTLPGGVTPEAGLPPPSDFTAVAVSGTQVDLRWRDNASDETGFVIYRATGTAAYATLVTLGANTTSYSDTTASPATTYRYQVQARRNATNSASANEVTITTPSGTAPAGWQAVDVGPVAATGSTTESGGVVTLHGSGRDIWNTEDEFHFRHLSWTGDGTITARVTGLTNTDGWAKAGLMFRESLTGPSRHVWMCVSSAHGTALQYREATGAESGTAPPSEAGGVPRWLRLTRSGDTFSGYESIDGVNWTQAGTRTLALPATVYVGLALTSHNDGVLGTATFSEVSIGGGTTSPPPPPPPPGTWAFADIGAVGLAGSNTSSGNTITISGSGEDIWGAADAFRFVYRSVAGDGVVEARVDSMQLTNGWAKAGVMIRESLAANARNVFAAVTPVHHGVVAQVRAATGGETTNSAGPGRNAPTWVRLQRTGGTITVAWSADGIAWTEFATHTVAMAETVYFGFAVTAHDNAQLNTAVFSDPFVQ